MMFTVKQENKSESSGTSVLFLINGIWCDFYLFIYFFEAVPTGLCVVDQFRHHILVQCSDVLPLI